LENISERHIRTVLRTRCSGCFQAKTAKIFFTYFSFDFWANVSEFFKQEFLLVLWSKETTFAFEKLGEDCKSIFSKLYSPSNKPSIFRK